MATNEPLSLHTAAAMTSNPVDVSDRFQTRILHFPPSVLSAEFCCVVHRYAYLRPWAAIRKTLGGDVGLRYFAGKVHWSVSARCARKSLFVFLMCIRITPSGGCLVVDPERPNCPSSGTRLQSEGEPIILLAINVVNKQCHRIHCWMISR